MRRFVFSQSPFVMETTSISGVTRPLKPETTDVKYFDGGARTTTAAPATASARSAVSFRFAGSSTPFRNFSFRRVRFISSM